MSDKFFYFFRPIYVPVISKTVEFKSYIVSSLKPYQFDKNRYLGTFLSENTSGSCSQLSVVSPIIYCFWTGDNEITPNRLKCLKSMKDNCGVKIELITPQNLATYILPESPLHKGYQYLSLVHRADYLRCYFMHHYGGGYTDIKRHINNWQPAFESINQSSNYVLGYREVGYIGVAERKGRIGCDLQNYWRIIAGNGAYICRPYTPFTFEWYTELNKRMDFYYDELVKNPGDIFGKNEGYPIPWNRILGAIFHPLCLKYHDRIILSDIVKPDFTYQYR